MRTMASIIIVCGLLLLVGGGLFLATWKIPAPAVDIERTIPNDRFKR